MRVKRYRAATMPEAIKKVRSDLGEEAVLLHSKTIYKKGFLGLFKKKMIEVTAGVDHAAPMQKSNEESRTVRKAEQRSLPLHSSEENVENLVQEIKELKETVQKFPQANSLAAVAYPNELERPVWQLQRQGVAEELVSELKNYLLDRWRMAGGQASGEQAIKWSKQWLAGKLRPIQEREDLLQAPFINMLGPTGVGKTTTIAKLAAEHVLDQGLKTAFISADTYRIAAIEQLKTYADLLKIPLEVVYEPREVKEAMERLKGCDIVYIDTAGRNYREEQFVNELQEILPFENMCNFLVLSLAAKEQDMREVIERFSAVPIHRFVFTKADETASHGSMINMLYYYQKPIAYITNGQSVPEDLIKPTTDQLAAMMLGEYYDA